MAHETLKTSTRIGKTKRQDIKFAKTVVCHKSCFCRDSGCISICQSPDFRSRIEKYLLPVKLSRVSDTEDIGKLCFLLTSFAFLKSTQKRKLPFIVLTRTTREFQGETDTLIFFFGACYPPEDQFSVYTEDGFDMAFA